ncbi:hypothetical protein MtrunA17_Chr1g0165121 [Medicago truncatula]|uniref:Uncharacterized protein n=1 Tax=Medicago truncatula TaxID=3880 RepID=A0A396JM00_MEDTR|nr:hypothetical protein MtrunA17_Chr1g0165121 [Medicago truncatula]
MSRRGFELAIPHFNTLKIKTMYFTFIKHYTNIQVLKILRKRKLFSTIMTTNLLIRSKNQINSPLRLKIPTFKNPNSFKILHTNTLHILGPSCINPSFIIHMGLERMMDPLIMFSGDHISVRVEHDGRQLRACTGPFENDDGFSGYQFDCLGFEYCWKREMMFDSSEDDDDED